MLQITDDITIAKSEIKEEFVRSSGPGGQNVNKVATAVQLRFDVSNSPSLPHDVRNRLIRLAGSRITENGMLIINARRFRSQERNRQDALDRLIALIHRAAAKPKPRHKTQAPLASKKRRIEDKLHRSTIKRMRTVPGSENY